MFIMKEVPQVAIYQAASNILGSKPKMTLLKNNSTNPTKFEKKETLNEFHIFLKLKNKTWLYPIVLLLLYCYSMTNGNKKDQPTS